METIDLVTPQGELPVPFEALVRCVAVSEARDPLVVPLPDGLLRRADALAIAHEDGEVRGVAWRFTGPDGVVLDARVLPGRRRQGIGRALLTAVSGPVGPWMAGADAAHRPARRFLTHLGFALRGVVFHQRWDGPESEVPPAFATAQMADAASGDDLGALLRDAGGGAAPRPPWARLAALDTLPAERVHRRVAWRDGHPVGVVLAHREAEVWEVDGLGVLPGARRFGIGRSLVTDLMRRAARAGLGVQLRVAQSDDGAVSWSTGLGFWTYRTWAMFERDAPL